MNFSLNAADALGERNGVIALRTGIDGPDRDFVPDFAIGTAPPGGVFLEIADTGCGIDARTLPLIFDPFFTTKFTGRGLGLAATQGIILRHNAALQVQSRPGVGTAFRVIFPVRPPGGAAAAAPPRAASQPWWASGIVLLVDDEAPVRAMASRMLSALGFEVLTAADGEEAVSLFSSRRGEIRAILLDQTMPRLNGCETFREVRRLQSDVPVVLCSGYDVQRSAEEFSNLGFSGFLQKPYRLDELKEVLRKALA
jgi:CheY-like chemotaxis protein